MRLMRDARRAEGGVAAADEDDESRRKSGVDAPDGVGVRVNDDDGVRDGVGRKEEEGGEAAREGADEDDDDEDDDDDAAAAAVARVRRHRVGE